MGKLLLYSEEDLKAHCRAAFLRGRVYGQRFHGGGGLEPKDAFEEYWGRLPKDEKGVRPRP
jgi:hypothetical protein